MSYPLNYPTPQNANIQIFNAGNTGVTFNHTWTKPQGASFVWFTLIGSGGGGDNSTIGGGSGAVTNCLVPAFLIPDVLRITVGKGGAVSNDGIITRISYYNKASYSLLEANAGTASSGVAGAASTSNYFSAMGFFQSIAGKTGLGTAGTASTTTFLSGGGNGAATVANYGYATDGVAGKGFFQTQPIIVGVGGGGSSNAGNGGIGCGGAPSGAGGDGLVVIITW